MRTLLVASVFALVTVLAAPGARAQDDPVTMGLAKFTRGLVNTATGLPTEILAGCFSAASQSRIDSASGYVADLTAAILMGIGRGVVRTGSGIVDLVTFPVPFDDNRPLFEPDYAL